MPVVAEAESLCDALASGHLDPSIATALGRSIGSTPFGVQPAQPAGTGGIQRAELVVFDQVTDADQQYGCSADTEPFAKALLTDDPLLEAFDELVTRLVAAPAVCLHGFLSDADAVMTSEKNGFAVPGSPTDTIVGAECVDIGGLLSCILLVAIERAHADDAPPPPEPTFPPAPLWSLSPVHKAAFDLWRGYVEARAAKDEVDEVSLLQLTAGYAGCQIMRQAIGGAAAFAKMANATSRAKAEKCAIGIGRELVLQCALTKLVDFDGVFTILESNVHTNKHAQPAKFEMFCDF